ncbi:MAG: glycogen debranching protein, partial [Rubrobacter sp.]|nr:glycogen debranching protein [Rubrobacter sp.]
MDTTGRYRSSSRSWVSALLGTSSLPGPAAWGALFALLLLSLAIPAAAQVASPSEQSPTLSVSDQLDDRRYVATGTRGYVVGTEAGRFPAMGWHIQGEMGGIWSPPIKLLDGLWFGVDGEWLGEATRFTSGYGFVQMDGIDGPEGLAVRRTDFVPDDKRGALVGLELTSPTDRQISLTVDAHSELMSAYPWGWTTPSASDYNLQDTSAYADGRLEFREQGKPHVNAEAHDWAAVVGSQLSPTGHATGEDFRGPQEPAEICPPEPCDEGASGKGAGGQLSYDVTLEAGQPRTVWVAVAGSEQGPADARGELDTLLREPEDALEQKISDRLALQKNTQLDIPGDPQLQESIDWSKQNLADSVQVAEDLQIRETDEGRQYLQPEGTIDQVRFLGAGFPDYPWLFGTDGEFTAFASVGVGQFEPIKDHLRALKEASLIDNGDSGKVVHEVVTDGSIYFGSNDDAGNTDETAKFPSAVALIWRWSGDNRFRDEMYGFSKSNMEYIFRELDDDNDGWPEGLGNVERAGMGEEKLDVTTSTIRGLYDLADMAKSKGDTKTFVWAMNRANRMMRAFEA